MEHQTVADLLVATLHKAGVERVYGITGDSANFITDSISKSSIRFVHVRHEEVAAFAAASEAAATDSLTVCMGSCGPGSLHLVNGLYEAHRNGVPVLAIATEIHKSQIGTRFVQEIDTREVFRGCSYFCEYVRSADQLPRIMGIAMQTAISKGGVAVVIITGEVSSEHIDKDLKPEYVPFYTEQIVHPSDNEMELLAYTLNQTQRVTIYGGWGCRGAESEVRELSKLLKAPLMWTYRAKEVLDYDNPYGVGMAGIVGTSAGDYAMNHCETLLLLGCGFAFNNMYPENAQIIQIDIAGENLARRHNISLGLVGDIKETVKLLLPMLKEQTDSEFADLCVKKYVESRQHLHNLTIQKPTSKSAIYPEHLMHMLNQKLSHEAWISADMGTSWAFMGRYIDSMGGRRFFTSSLHGTMATAMPFTIGMTLADPRKQVVAICGDGGLSMLMGDLLTLKQEHLKPKLFILNNSSLDFVSMEMKADGLLDSFTKLENPNFAAVAEAIGIKGIRVERVSDLEVAIDEALLFDGAVLVDVVVDALSMLMPPKITASMVGKYSHYVSKMVCSGNSEALLEEALVNLRTKI